MNEFVNLLAQYKQHFELVHVFLVGVLLFMGVRIFFDKPLHVRHKTHVKALGLSMLPAAGLFLYNPTWMIWIFGACVGVVLWTFALTNAQGLLQKSLVVSGVLMISGCSVGMSTGYVPSLSMGPSMWPAASKGPSFNILNTRSTALQTLAYGDDIEFETAEKNENGWPRGRYRKRLWGMPGDVVRVEEHAIFINDQQVADCRFKAQLQIAPRVWWCHATLPNGRSQKIVWGSVNYLNYGSIEVRLQKGQWFAMGDNTPESGDSREYGAIKSSWIQGRFDHATPTSEPWVAW